MYDMKLLVSFFVEVFFLYPEDMIEFFVEHLFHKVITRNYC